MILRQTAFTKTFLMLFLAILLSILSGCTTVNRPVRFEPMIRLSPSSFGEPASLYQQIHAELNGKKQDMNVVLEVTPEKLTMVGIAMERRMMTITYDGKELETWKDGKLPEQVQPEIVLSNIQLALWPIEAVRKGLPEGWAVVEENHLKRKICFNNATIIRIEYSQKERWLGTIKMTDTRYHYGLTIQSVPLS